MSNGADESPEQGGRRPLLIRLGVAAVALAVVIDLAIVLTQPSQAGTRPPVATAAASPSPASLVPSAAPTATPSTAALPPPPAPTPCVLQSAYHQDNGQGSAVLATPSCNYGGTGFYFHVTQACQTTFTITGPGVNLAFSAPPNSAENEPGEHRSTADSGYTINVRTQDDCDWGVDLIAQ